MVALLYWFESQRKSKDNNFDNFYGNLKFATGKTAKNKKAERLMSPFLTISSNSQNKKNSNINKKLNINNGIINNLKNEDDHHCSNCDSN